MITSLIVGAIVLYGLFRFIGPTYEATRLEKAAVIALVMGVAFSMGLS